MQLLNYFQGIMGLVPELHLERIQPGKVVYFGLFSFGLLFLPDSKGPCSGPGSLSVRAHMGKSPREGDDVV